MPENNNEPKLEDFIIEPSVSEGYTQNQSEFIFPEENQFIDTSESIPSFDEFVFESQQNIVREAETIEAPLEADKVYRKRFDPTAKRDVSESLKAEPIRNQLESEFEWLNSPPKIKDKNANAVLDRMVELWHSNIEPKRKLELLRKWRAGASRFVGAEGSMVLAEQQFAPSINERMLTEESFSGDVLRTASGAGLAVAQMGASLVNAVADITPFVPENVRQWLADNEQDLVESSNIVLDEIKKQGGEYAVIAQRVGQDALQTALRVAMMQKLPLHQMKSKILQAVRLATITAATTSGTFEARRDAGIRAAILMSTSIPAKGIVDLLKVKGAAAPFISFAVDAGLNVGLGAWFDPSRYNFSEPAASVSALLTDVIFAAQTGAETSKDIRQRAKYAELRARAEIAKKQYIEQEGTKAEEEFKKAEETRPQRVTESDVVKSQEQDTAEVQTEINRLLPVGKVVTVTAKADEANVKTEPQQPVISRTEELRQKLGIKPKTEGETILPEDISRPATVRDAEVKPAEPIAAETITAKAEEAPTPERQVEATKAIEEVEQLKQTDRPKALNKVIEIENILYHPLERSELETMPDSKLVKIAKDLGVDMDALSKRPNRKNIIGAINDAQNRIKQYEDTGRVEPIKNLTARQAIINKALGLKKAPATPQERENYQRKIGIAEGTLAGEIRGMRKGIKQGRIEGKQLAKTMFKAEKERITDLQTSLREMSKDVFTDKDERNAFEKRISDVKTLNSYNKLADSIEARAEFVVKRKTIGKIKNDLSDFRKGKMIPSIMKAMKQELASALGLSDSYGNIESIFKDTQDTLARHGIVDIPESPRELSKMIESSAKSMSVEELDAIIKNINILKSASEKTLEAQYLKIVQENEANAQTAKESIADAKRGVFLFGTEEKQDTVKEAQPLLRGITASIGKLARRWLVNLDSKALILDAGKEDGIHRKLFYDNFIEATRKQDDVINKNSENIGEINKLVGDGWAGKKINITLQNGKKLNLTNGKKIALLLTSLDPSGYKDMLESGIRDSESQKNVVYTEDDVNKMWSDATPTELAIVNIFRNGIDNDITPHANKAFETLNGYSMPGLRENYFRTFREHDASVKPSERDVVTIEGAGWLKHKHAGGKNPIVLNDAFDIYAKLVQQTARYSGFAQPIRQARALLNDKSYRETIAAKFGTETLKELEAHINRIEGEKFNIADEEGALLKFLTASQTSYINMNPGTIVKQLPSMMYAWARGVPMKYIEDNLFTIVPKKEIFDNSSILKRRYVEHLFERETRLQHETKGLLGSIRRGISEKGIMKADRMAISRIWAATKDMLATEQGLSGKELLEKTARITEDIVMRTQPTSDPMNQTLLQSEKTLIPRVLSMFSNQRSKMNNMVLQGYVERINAKTPEEKQVASEKFGKAIILYTLTQGAIMGSIDVARKRLFQNAWEKIANYFNPSAGKIENPTTAIEEVKNAALRSFIGMFPFGRELYTIGETISKGKKVMQLSRSGQLDSALGSSARDMAFMLDEAIEGGKALVGKESDFNVVDALFSTIVASDRVLGVGYSVPAKIAKDMITAGENVVKLQEQFIDQKIKQYLNGDVDYKNVSDYIYFSIPANAVDKNGKSRRQKYIEKFNKLIKTEAREKQKKEIAKIKENL